MFINKVYDRRVTTEMNIIRTTYKNCTLELVDKYTIRMYYNDTIFAFILDRMYPYKYPILQINNIEYIDYFIKKQTKYMIPFLNIKCPCCYNVSCEWCPSNGMDTLLKDYFLYNKLFSHIFNFSIIYNKLKLDDLIYKKILDYLI